MHMWYSYTHSLIHYNIINIPSIARVESLCALVLTRDGLGLTRGGLGLIGDGCSWICGGGCSWICDSVSLVGADDNFLTTHM